VVSRGSGSDVITGGDGDDVIDARDGAVDTVTCGAGEDVAKLDDDDVIADATADNPNGSCETVLRGDSASGPGNGAGKNCPKDGARGGGRMRPQGDRPAEEDPSES